MPANEYYDSTGAPATRASLDSAAIRAEFNAIEAAFNKSPTLSTGAGLPVFINAGGTAQETKSLSAALTALGAEGTANKDASNGYAGLTLLKINFMNVLGTFKSFFTNSNTAARTYIFQDRNGTIADDTDLVLKEATANKDVSGGYPGLTLLKINFLNTLGTFTSFFTNSNTAARTYTFQDRDGTIADDTDLALKAPLASPALTGTPTAPTVAATDNSTKIATTAHIVQSFPGVASTNGYQKFKNGMTIQYGSLVTSSTPAAATNAFFPLAYTAVYSIVLGLNNSSGTTWTSYIDTTRFDIHSSEASKTVYWMAIGYITPA